MQRMPAPGVATEDPRELTGGEEGAPRAPGPLGRLAAASARRPRIVLLIWAIIMGGLGMFAPQAERSLSGAGWEASGSDSVKARELINREFGGLSATGLQVVVASDRPVLEDPRGQQVLEEAETILTGDPRVGEVVMPRAGESVSGDGRTAVLTAGAAADPNTMVEAADELKGELTGLSGEGIQVSVTGSSAMWSDFNEANMDAMVRSELLSWPVTMLILVLAFGSLVAAGLPLMLTILGLMASAGVLTLVTGVVPVSIWAMNFAMMFALALGIDYALFIVMRFRAALSRQPAGSLDPAAAVTQTMDTAGKAVLFSGLTVLVSLSAVMLVPSPAFRSMAFGIVLSVVFVLTATLTLLPVVLARLGGSVNRFAIPFARPSMGGSETSRAWAKRLWDRPVVLGTIGLLVLLALSLPLIGLRTGMPSIAVVPEEASSRTGYNAVQAGLGPGAPGAFQVVVPTGEDAMAERVLRDDPGVAQVQGPQASGSGWSLVGAVPVAPPSSEALGETIDRLRERLPDGTLVGGAAVESHDLERLLDRKTPLVIGVVLTLGFLLMLVALQAPLISALAVVTNLLAVGATFGIARLIFQDGHGAELLGFTSQGFLNAWAPVFFFAMIFALSMDYTVFLLATAKEYWDATGDPRATLFGGLVQTGRVIFSAAAVMVAVFLTFALSGPLPPKEMGIILAIAVLLDAALVRLLLVPVLLRLTGRAGWWSPAWLRWILPTVRFGHGGGAGDRP